MQMLPRRSYQRLPVLILLTTLAVLMIGGVALYYVQTRLVAMVGESLALAAAGMADMLDRLLFERYSDIPMMAQARVFQEQNAAGMTEYLIWMKKNYPVYRWLGVTDAHGRIVAATNPASMGTDLSSGYMFRTVRDRDVIHMQDVEVSVHAGGVPVVAFAGPIVDSRGKFLGVVMSQVGLSSLEDVATTTVRTFQALRGPAGKIEYQILTRDGDIIVDSLLKQEMKVNLKFLALPSALLSASAQPGYVEEEHRRRKVSVVTGFAQTDGAGFEGFTSLHWGVLVRMDRSDILAPIRTVLQNLAIAGAVVVLPLLGFLLWTSGRLLKEEETLLRQQIEQYVLLDLIPAMVWYKNTRNCIIRANRAAAESIGRSIAEIEGKSAYELYPDEAEKYYQDDLEVINSGKPKLGIMELYRTASGEKRWVQTDKVPYRNAQDDIIGVLVFSQDITERKRLEDQRMQVEKLAALGQVAAGVAHEINNPLAGIKNSFLLIKEAILPTHPYYGYVSMIDREIARISDIVRQMYQLYRPDPAESRPVDLGAILRDVSQIMSVLVRQRRLIFITEVPPHFPQVRLPQRDLTQILCNLIRNAVEASQPGGQIRVSVAREGEAVRIAVRDHGEGMLPEVASRIFEPFFTTKMGSTQGGMGLGLSVSRSLIEAIGGRIEVRTEVGRGSTFTVVLPCDLALASLAPRLGKEQPDHV